MSIFGSRKKTTVGTQVMRVIEDNALPNSIRSGNLAALLQNRNDATDFVMEEMSSGLAITVDRMYRYAKRAYTNGLPVGETFSAVTGREVVEQAMETEVGPVDSITYYYLGAVNMLHFGWMKLVQDYDYNSVDNTLLVDGARVYLSDMKPVVVESTVAELQNGSMDQWKPLPNAGHTPAKAQLGLSTEFISLASAPVFTIDAGAASDHLKVEYCWEIDEIIVVEGINVPRKTIRTGDFTIAFTGVNEASSYFQVRYLTAGRAGYWMYQLGSGKKPEVEAVFDSAPTTIGTFYPWTYFRYDKKAITTDRTSEEFRTMNRMLKTISMDLGEITDAIHENPDIADIEQAMMMLAVPAKTEDPMERRYLYDFFTKLWVSLQASAPSPTSPTSGDIASKFNKPAGITTITIRDKKFKMALSFGTIIKRRVAGSIGDVGDHDSGYNLKTDVAKGVDETGATVEWPTFVPTHYYRRQITENIYEELLVTGLKMVYWIWGDYTATGDETDDILMVPLDFEIVETYQMLDRETLYGRSLHYIFNSRVVTKLKWYQTGIFRAVMIVVAIVVTVLSLGSAYQTIVAAAAAGTSALVVAVISIVVKYLVVGLAIRMFVKVVGARFAIIAAVLAAAFGAYQMISSGSVAGAPWSQELLAVSSSLTKEAVRVESLALRQEFIDFEQYAEEQSKLLEDTQKLLENSNHLTPMIIFGESPDDFYQRTVHSGNIGVVGIEAVSSFVEMKLKLPKLSDTQGDFV